MATNKKKPAPKKSSVKKPEAEQRPDPTELVDHGSASPMALSKPTAARSNVTSAEDPTPTDAAPRTSALGGLSFGSKAGSAPHVIVEARAGTGKTTTLIGGLCNLKGIPLQGIIPSPQQQAVWDQIALSNDARTICFVAFNKSITTELQRRVPPGCDAMTMHSMGLKAVTKQFGRVEIDGNRVYGIIEKLTGDDIRELRKNKGPMLNATESLVALCKQNLVNGEPEELDELCSRYDVDLDEYRRQVYELVPQVLAYCKDPSKDGRIDFNDMIWLPVVLNLPVFKYDLLLVDEAQDLNRCQQALAKKAGRRLILCGDPKQAIYAFAGADPESMNRMAVELADVMLLPLTVTRRCGKAIVREANRYVPDFEAHESNCEGKISRYTLKPGAVSEYRSFVEDGNMILCRCNAPLVSECFKFLKAGRKATIQGRDIGQGLISTIKKMKAGTVEELVGKLDDWRVKEEAKELAKRIPSDTKLQSIRDRVDCLICFTEGCVSVDEVIGKITAIFTDNKSEPGIRLSSIHKAKGLEAKRVFILQGKGMTGPPLDKLADWEQEQERNLIYVAVTRAIEELAYVRD